ETGRCTFTELSISRQFLLRSSGWLEYLRYRAASGFDRGLRASGGLDALQVHRLGDFAREDHAHVAGQHRQNASLLEHHDVDVANSQVVQVRQTHFCFESGVEGLEAALRQTALQRHLT